MSCPYSLQYFPNGKAGNEFPAFLTIVLHFSNIMQEFHELLEQRGPYHQI